LLVYIDLQIADFNQSVFIKSYGQFETWLVSVCLDSCSGGFR